MKLKSEFSKIKPLIHQRSGSLQLYTYLLTPLKHKYLNLCVSIVGIFTCFQHVLWDHCTYAQHNMHIVQ